MSRAAPPKAPRDPLYHMKLVVRGARGVGKSSLLARLQGARAIPSAHTPTPEIQTASISWTYKNTDDKIEVVRALQSLAGSTGAHASPLPHLTPSPHPRPRRRFGT